MEQSRINWYPGHMKKATDHITKKLSDIDFVVEVLDSRAIELTSNKELYSLIQNKPLIRIALKHDLSDITSHEGVLIGSIKDINFKKKVIFELENCFKQKIESLKKKGLVKPNFIGMVVGIPNIGKSSLINFLAPKKTLITENRAGVTKKQSTKKINDNFYLIDTPGVLVKKIKNDTDGYKLCILNCISKKVIPYYEVLKFHFDFLKTNYKDKLFQYFKGNNIDFNNFDTFMSSLANSKKFILESETIDEGRLFEFLFNIFSESKITKFHF